MRFQQKCADARKRNVETKIEFIAAHILHDFNRRFTICGSTIKKKAEKLKKTKVRNSERGQKWKRKRGKQ